MFISVQSLCLLFFFGFVLQRSTDKKYNYFKKYRNEIVSRERERKIKTINVQIEY